ncbi:MAG: anhydro-N-acetylmuramic acid kinase [Cellvibrionaceae bacterium]|nr:anhydro-N-acetylmuramic acid kinase [Cellvibrionaceae bacterium]
MNHDFYIGLLSGTSADGIDGALVDFGCSTPKIVSTYIQPIDEKTRRTIFELSTSGEDEINKIRLLDHSIATLCSETAHILCRQAKLDTKAIQAIGSHGQTVRHYPPDNKQNGYSLQVGDPNIIAENTGITTVADFRRRDIAAEGHGAPLAPILHEALFHSTGQDRMIVNTGGIANITYLPAQGETIGFDTGPANALMDSWCQLHTNQAYDKDGQWAAQGEQHTQLLGRLLAHPYFHRAIPKSTGRETFNLSWLNAILDQYEQKIRPVDVQATLLALTTTSISRAIQALDRQAKAEVYICGGGAHNHALCEQLALSLAPRPFSHTGILGLAPDWVEAVAFAWLAKQTLAKATGNLPAATGAQKKVILGGIYY